MKRTATPRSTRKKKPARVRLSVEDRRRQLVTLGRRAFIELPFDEVSIDDIAREAGISRGLLFHYFPTKRDYYIEVLKDISGQLLSDVIGKDELPPVERLLRGLDRYFAFVEKQARAYSTLLKGGGASDPLIYEALEDSRQTFIESIRKQLPPPPNKAKSKQRAALRSWVGHLEALALDWIDHKDLSREELTELAVGAILLVPGATDLLPS